MGEISFTSLNINGARDFRKRVQAFELMKHKNIDVLFLQETHSDIDNTADLNGMAILSLFTLLSGSVAMLFSMNFIPYSYNVEDVIKGRLLKISASFENSYFVFVCVYAPTNALDRIIFLNTLDKILSDCNNDDFLNTRRRFDMDRNHVEPPMQSRKRLFQLIKSNSIIDVWRNVHGT